MRHIISVLMENESGALSRVVGLFSARGYNIDSLSVSTTEDLSLSRLTLMTNCSEEMIEQVTKQLNKLIEVVKVCDLMDGKYVERELLLLKVRAAGNEKDEILRLVQIFRGKILDIANKTVTVELTGTQEKLDSFIEIVGKNSILETVRSGVLGLGRGERMLKI